MFWCIVEMATLDKFILLDGHMLRWYDSTSVLCLLPTCATRSALELSRNDHIYCRMVVVLVQLTSGTIAKEMLFSYSHAIDTLTKIYSRETRRWLVLKTRRGAEPAMRHAELRSHAGRPGRQSRVHFPHVHQAWGSPYSTHWH